VPRYSYDKTGVNYGALLQEIQAAGLPVDEDRPFLDDRNQTNNLSVGMTTALDAGQQTTLDAVIANHMQGVETASGLYGERLDSLSSTASKPDTLVYLTLSIGYLVAGEYDCGWHALIEAPATSSDWTLRVLLTEDGGAVTKITNPGGDGFVQEEGKDTGSDQRNPRGGSRRVSLPAGTYTMTLEFGRSSNSGTTVMHYGNLRVAAVK
jgi:hypothetical protein